MKRSKITLAMATALASIAMSHSTFAETAENEAEDVEKVIVYGQKIERTLQETKESVAVISSDYIDSIGMLDIEDAYLATANAFTLSNGENFGIRGITQNAQSTGGGNGELGSFYMDGVAYVGFATRFGPRDLWDVQQIEILRGPQSTNVGRQALIGAVVVETMDPDLSGFDAAVRGQIGNLGTLSGEAMVNLVVSDNSALRITAETFTSDGFIDNTFLGTHANPEESNLLRAKYLIEPVEDLSVELTLQYTDRELGWDTYRSDLTSIGSFQDRSNLESEETYEAYSVALDVQYDFNEAWSLRSISSFIEGDYFRFNDDDGSPSGGNAFRGRDVDDRNWAQELRFTYQSDNLNGVFGLYYTDVDLANNTIGTVALNPQSLGVPPVLLPFYPTNLIIEVGIPAQVNTTNAAFFTEWDYQLSESITLSAGFRYDREEQKTLTNALNTLAAGSELPDPVGAGQFAASMGFDEATVAQIVGGITQVNGLLNSQLIPTDNERQDTTFNAFLPQFGITYDVDDDISVSAFYKRGYRAGGVDVDTVGSVDEYDEETLDNVELAFRSLLLDGDLVFNANVYYGWWKDQQLTVFVNGSQFDTDTVNAGESVIYGAEFEVRYQVDQNTNVYASFGLAKTEFDEFCFVDGTPADQITGTLCDAGDGIGQDLDGNDFAASPDITLSIGARHYFNDNWFLSGNVTRQGRAFSDVQNTPEFENDGFTLVNLNVGYMNDNVEDRAYARNLFDEFYTNFQGPGIGQDPETGLITSRLVNPGVPREFGVMVSYRY